MKKNNQKIILEITEKIKSDYRPEKIILYGSFAYGKPDKDSDIDLLIIKKTDERPIDRRIAVRKIVDIHQPISFSPFVITPKELNRMIRIKDQFIQEILTKGKVLYG